MAGNAGTGAAGPSTRRTGRVTVDNGPSTFLDIIETEAPLSECRDSGHAGAIAMLVSRDSGLIDGARAALMNRSRTLDEVLRSVGGYRIMTETPGHSSLAVELWYLDRPVMRVAIAHSGRIAVAMVPFPGGAIAHRHFSIRRQAMPGAEQKLQILVAIQHPRLSDLERDLNGIVPVDLGALNQSLFVTSRPSLLVMEEGWALGGLLAKVAVVAMRGAWEKDASLDSANPTQRPEPSAGLDLSVTAEALRRRFEADIRGKQHWGE